MAFFMYKSPVLGRVLHQLADGDGMLVSESSIVRPCISTVSVQWPAPIRDVIFCSLLFAPLWYDVRLGQSISLFRARSC